MAVPLGLRPTHPDKFAAVAPTATIAANGHAYELCTRYPNVYCEVTIGDSMIDEAKQAFFVSRVATLFTESAGHPGHDDGLYPFAKKLMYGTDWYLPDKGKPHAVLQAAQKAFLHPSLRDHYADYVSGNARRHLKLGASTKQK